MKFLLLIYADEAILRDVPPARFDHDMRLCLEHADQESAQGRLLAYQQLEEPRSAKSLRVRAGRTTVIDGPFAETKEMLAGFNLVEADSMEDAVRMAKELPWAAYGCVEVRAVRDIAAVRRRVGAATVD